MAPSSWWTNVINFRTFFLLHNIFRIRRRHTLDKKKFGKWMVHLYRKKTLFKYTFQFLGTRFAIFLRTDQRILKLGKDLTVVVCVLCTNTHQVWKHFFLILVQVPGNGCAMNFTFSHGFSSLLMDGVILFFFRLKWSLFIRELIPKVWYLLNVST